MNYPLWDLRAPDLLISCVSILHVFVSHFAIGGGLFLVVFEWKARHDSDAARIFEENRSPRHSPATEWPMEQRLKGRSARELHDLPGRLPDLNPSMPAPVGSDAGRHALSEHPAAWPSARRESEDDRKEEERDRHE